jgi:hypothetical protein
MGLDPEIDRAFSRVEIAVAPSNLNALPGGDVRAPAKRPPDSPVVTACVSTEGDPTQ